jgi:hypothetical protein
MYNVCSLGSMVCRLHQIDGIFVNVAYFEIFVDCCMFTFVSKTIISWIVAVLFTMWVDIVEYKCAYSLWDTGLCVLCCVQSLYQWGIHKYS